MPGLDVATIKLILHDPVGHQILSDKNGIHLGNMTFPRAKPGNTEVIDNLTVKAGDLILVVNQYHSTPVTLFKENGKVMAETPSYEPNSRQPTGTVTAELTAGGLEIIRIAPLPGHTLAPSLPDWQKDSFKRPDFLRQMRGAAKYIK
jgi:hypothetical protein